MSEEPSPLSDLWPLAPGGATDWLFELCGDGLTGFMPPAMPDAAWVLNAMYEHEHEHERGLRPVTHHDHRQARLAEGSTPRDIIGGIDLDAVTVTTGGGLGRAGHPGPGWRRLPWAELARRTGDPVVPDGLLPSYRCFPRSGRTAAGRSASPHPPRGAWTARPGSG
ncbi:hypothetical protein [Kitasatospora purpeofusca]|uniref:hypothetical protein n=1 Tax=Kitasatospora purpeofusca TaxID=67352 RepID=UPI0036C2F8B6